MSGMIDIFTNALNNENEINDKYALAESDSLSDGDITKYFKIFNELTDNFTKIKTSYYNVNNNNVNGINVNNNYFKELCNKFDGLYFLRFALYHLLKSVDPSDITIKTELNNFLFSDNPDENCIKNKLNFDFMNWVIADYDKNLQLTKFKGLTKSSMELMKKTYDRYFKMKELFDSNEITKLNTDYSSFFDEFIRIQPVENLQKYLTNLNGIYTGLYSEKTESTASELKKKITNLVVGELDNFFRGTLDENKFAYISRYIKLDDIFFPFIASYTESEFVDLKNKIKGTTLEDLFQGQVNKAKEKYKDNHKLYSSKIEGKIKDLQGKLSIDDYGVAKLLLTNANKLTKELQTSYTRFLQITNIYDEKEKEDFKLLLKERITIIQTLLKKIVEKEAFLKDKEFNNKQKKDHQFTLGIELLTNVQGNEKLKYSPNMTIPSGGGDAIYFTPKRAMHQNIIESIPLGKPPEYKYIQLTKLPDFNSLFTRLSSGYFLEADEPFDEYSKVYKKKNDDLTNANIKIVLDTLFDNGSPFYIGSDRYTAFSYDWDNGVEKITKNDKKETYGDEDDSIIKGLTGPTGIQWQNIFGTGSTGTTGITSGLSRPSFSFTSEVGEVGKMLEEHKSDELTHGSIVDNSESNEVGKMLEEHKSDELTHDSTVDNSESNEVGKMLEEHKSAELTHDSTVDNSESNEVGITTTTTPTIIPTTTPTLDELTRGSTSVDNSEANEVGSATITPTINNEASTEEHKSDELTRGFTLDNSEASEAKTTTSTNNALARGFTSVDNGEAKTTTIDTTSTSVDNNEALAEKKTSLITKPEVEHKDDVFNSKEEEKSDFSQKMLSKNTDRKKNFQYVNKISSNQPTNTVDRFLKLLRLEQTKDVNSINLTSIIEGASQNGGSIQVGGANALYIDLDQETTLYSQKKKELENEVKKQQEDELALLSKQSEDLNKDESVQEVKWKYFVTVELQLYPGDHIPLSAYASLACSKKSNDIYNIWQNILTKIKNPDSKEKYKKKMLAYVPVIPNKTVKNKENAEPVTKNNTVKVRDSVKPSKP